MSDEERAAIIAAINKPMEEHAACKWEQVGPCVYCSDHDVRLYQGQLPAGRNPAAAICERDGSSMGRREQHVPRRLVLPLRTVRSEGVDRMTFDPEPQPSDGPEYVENHRAWVRRQAPSFAGLSDKGEG